VVVLGKVRKMTETVEGDGTEKSEKRTKMSGKERIGKEGG
jgi:hypothetical protein